MSLAPTPPRRLRPATSRWLELALSIVVGVCAGLICASAGSTLGGFLAALLTLGWVSRLIADWPRESAGRRPDSEPPLEPREPATGARAIRPQSPEVSALLTRSGVYQLSELASDSGVDPMLSGEYATLDMVNRLDPVSLRWLESSPAEQAYLGWPFARLRAMSFLDIVRPDHRDLAREQLLSAVSRGDAHGLVFGIRTSQGEPRAIEVNASARYDSNGTASHLRCHLTDVTEQLRADRNLRRRTRQLTHANEQLRQTNLELRELKERYGDLYQNAPVMYFSLDREGRFVDLNDTMLNALGMTRERLVGQSYLTILPEEAHASYAERFARYLEVGRFEAESRWLRSDGGRMEVWITATAHLDASGAVSHSRSVATDITLKRALETKLRETNAHLERLNDELTRRNRELDDFGRIVSHDLRQPIRTVIGFADLLLSDHAAQLAPEAQDYLRYMAGASKRMRSLVEALLSHGRAGRVLGDLQTVPLGEVVASLRSDLGGLLSSLGGSIEVAGPMPEVLGDRERLTQLLGNLIGNGLKYNRSSRPRVTVSAVTEPSGDWVTLEVRDNGIGISPRHHAEIFKIFRRLHAEDEFEGTGAGLSICQKIAEAHGGSIEVESAEGEGATFRVRLPARRAELGRGVAQDDRGPRGVISAQYPHGESNPGPQAENLVS